MKLPFSGRRYYLKFGLERDPFPQNSAEQKVFLTHDMIHCLDQIKTSVDTSQQLVVIASPAGAGKSVLSRYLGFIKSQNWFVGHIQGHRELDRETLAYEIIRQHFPERKFVQSQAIYLLKEFLQLFARNGRTPVVIIDDAHLLPPDTLGFMLEIAAYRQQNAQYRFVLFGDISIDEKLKDPNLRGLIPDRYHHFRIPSLSLQQTGKYLEYRLSLCGEVIENPFTEESVQSIFQQSAGLPGDVHAPAKKIMQEYHVEGQDQQILKQAAITASVCLLVFSGVYSAMNEDYMEKAEKVAEKRNTSKQVIALNLPGTGTVIKPVAKSRTEEIKQEPAVVIVKADKKKPVAKAPRSEGFFSRLFGLKNADQSEPVHMVASLDSQFSLKLSEVIDK